MKAYIVNDDGTFGGEVEVYPLFGVLPDNMTRIPPPQLESGFVAVFDKDLREWGAVPVTPPEGHDNESLGNAQNSLSP